jgi:hypothetical protein
MLGFWKFNYTYHYLFRSYSTFFSHAGQNGVKLLSSSGSVEPSSSSDKRVTVRKPFVHTGHFGHNTYCSQTPNTYYSRYPFFYLSSSGVSFLKSSLAQHKRSLKPILLLDKFIQARLNSGINGFVSYTPVAGRQVSVQGQQVVPVAWLVLEDVWTHRPST